MAKLTDVLEASAGMSRLQLIAAAAELLELAGLPRVNIRKVLYEARRGTGLNVSTVIASFRGDES